MADKKAETTSEGTATKTLRALWTQSAAAHLKAVREGRPPKSEEVLKLQDTLEAIESREELDRLNAIARGGAA